MLTLQVHPSDAARIPTRLPRFAEAFRVSIVGPDGREYQCGGSWEPADSLRLATLLLEGFPSTLNEIRFVATTMDADYADVPRGIGAAEIVWTWEDGRWVSSTDTADIERFCRFRGVPPELLYWPHAALTAD